MISTPTICSGSSRFSRDDSTFAQCLINLALAIRPNDTAAMGNLGVSYLRDGQLEPSLQWFDLAASLQPDSPVALANAAEVRYRMGRHGDAVPLLKRAHQLDPSNYGACNLLGACHLALGDASSAARVFESATPCIPTMREPGRTYWWHCRPTAKTSGRSNVRIERRRSGPQRRRL